MEFNALKAFSYAVLIMAVVYSFYMSIYIMAFWVFSCWIAGVLLGFENGKCFINQKKKAEQILKIARNEKV
jgi:hypothetical protein